MGPRPKLLTVDLGGTIVVGLGAAGFTVLQPDKTFCHTSAIIVSPEARVEHGDLVLLDQTSRPPNRCSDVDLWHYPEWTLEGVDGVMFNDCRLTWVDGGPRTPAADIDLPCFPTDL